jgi:hypothetical protein
LRRIYNYYYFPTSHCCAATMSTAASPPAPPHAPDHAHTPEIPLLVDAVPINGEPCAQGLARYQQRYAHSMTDPDAFWAGE